jgi:enoyl-CoA hydratase
MASSTVDVEVGRLGPGVATVTLDDPDRRNALFPETVAGLIAAFDRLDADPEVGAVVITGTPPAFCAGGALADLERLSSAEDAHAIYEGFLRVARSPLPTVAAVNGPAVGAGLNLALCCDLRLASPEARFDARFMHLGIHPGGGNTWMLRQVVGPQAAAAMVLFNQPVGGHEAERIGLVWRCVPTSELLADAGRLATQVASFPRALVQRTKQTLTAMAGVADQEHAVDLEVDAQVWSVGQPEFKARLAELQAQISGR